MAIHGGDEAPRWTEWDGATAIAPEHGFAWIDVVDPDGNDIGKLQRAFGLHELAVEDSMSLAQLAKVDLYADHVFVVAKAAELGARSEEHTSELQSLMRISHAVFCLKNNNRESKHSLIKTRQKDAAPIQT